MRRRHPTAPAGTVGILYLIHFVGGALGDTSRPRMSARHYLGWCAEGELEARLAEHRAGRGASITAAAVAAGLSLEVVWTGAGTRDDERRMKRAGNHARRCVTCKAEAALPDGNPLDKLKPEPVSFDT